MASLCDRFDAMDMKEGAQAVVNLLKNEIIQRSQPFTAEYLSHDLIKKLNTLQGRECFYIRAQFPERYKFEAPSRVTIKCDACKLTLHFDKLETK